MLNYLYTFQDLIEARDAYEVLIRREMMTIDDWMNYNDVQEELDKVEQERWVI